MPIVSIPTKAVEKLAELKKAAQETDETWDIAFEHGFMEGLRALLPSETIGLIIIEADCLLEGVPGLPRFQVVAASE